MASDEKIIKDAQYRKGLSIAFFNATNAAINIVCTMPDIKDMTNEHILERVKFFREKFLEEHKEYYANVIANVGTKIYKAEDAIKRLEATKNLEELKSVYLSLSADERRDEGILKITNDLKKSYATT
jgi:hypothetical protein